MNVLFTSQMVGNVEIKTGLFILLHMKVWQILTVELQKI